MFHPDYRAVAPCSILHAASIALITNQIVANLKDHDGATLPTLRRICKSSAVSVRRRLLLFPRDQFICCTLTQRHCPSGMRAACLAPVTCHAHRHWQALLPLSSMCSSPTCPCASQVPRVMNVLKNLKDKLRVELSDLVTEQAEEVLQPHRQAAADVANVLKHNLGGWTGHFSSCIYAPVCACGVVGRAAPGCALLQMLLCKPTGGLQHVQQRMLSAVCKLAGYWAIQPTLSRAVQEHYLPVYLLSALLPSALL